MLTPHGLPEGTIELRVVHLSSSVNEFEFRAAVVSHGREPLPSVDAPVSIGTTMRYLMYHDVYGEPDNAQRLWAELPAEQRRLSGIDFSGANRACPNGIDVARHMRRAAEVFHA